MAPLKILFLSAEVAPFAKTGGLGDVAGALPKALAKLGHDVRVAMPAYGSIEAKGREGIDGIRPMPGPLDVTMGVGTIRAGVLEGRLPGSEVPIYFLAERYLFDRPQVYGYADDPWRFAFFSRAALELIPVLGFRPDVVHASDWHAAPAVSWLAGPGTADDRFRGIPTLYTIHNLIHQGISPWSVAAYLGIQPSRMSEERYGELNLMARGIHDATMINTVSPTYAREILTPGGGAGLDGILSHRQFDVHGIVNGIDTDVWNPASDAHLAKHFDVKRISAKEQNKRALQERAGLPPADVPLVAMVTRLDAQKGMEITGHVVHRLLNAHAGEAQFVLLGSGASAYEDIFRSLATYHREKMAAILTYAPDLAPLVYGGSDLFLMPSLFEPCGLSQMIAMRYGSVPVVRATGGLADTVKDGITGFSFGPYDTGAFWEALSRALHIYNNDRKSWRAIVRNDMREDFSWDRSATGYVQLYEWAIARNASA
jgi:starch synthase